MLDLSVFETDVLCFRCLAGQSGQAELETAARLYTGDVLDGIDIEGNEFETWRRAESARHRDQSVDVLMRLMVRFEESGDAERAIEAGTSILRLEPLHEVAARRLMRLYGRSGRRGAALGIYRSLAQFLRKEVGAEPEAETRALFSDLSRGVTEDGGAPPPSVISQSKLPHHAARTSEQTADLLQRAEVTSSQAVPFKRKSYRPFGIVGAALAGAVLASFGLRILLGPQLLAPSLITRAARSTSDAAISGTLLSRDTVTVAVLPFVNLSNDASQDFFSDGITEDINAALAKVPGLSVVARVSAFTLKGQNKDARTVGQELGASHLIRGSVRKTGQRVRIAAQLVRANDGIELWSQNYERNLTDIFAIQEEIAASIARALQVPLGFGRSENLVNNRIIDPESYENYFRGNALFEARGGTATGSRRNLTAASALLEDVVARNPGYAPAWSLLAGTYFARASNSVAADIADAPAVANELRNRGEAAGQRSAQLDPNSPYGYDALAVFAWSRAKIVETEDLLQKALALDPLEPNALGAYAIRLGTIGRLKQALNLAETAIRVDPYYLILAAVTVEDRWLNGQTESAIALAKTLRANDRARLLTLIYASVRRFSDAADALMELAADDARSDTAKAARLLRMASEQPSSHEAAPRLPPGLTMLYLYLGTPELALLDYERAVDVGFLTGNWGRLWHADYAPVRKTERFKALMRKAGLVDYWRVRGWPEHCRPTIDMDFVCD